MYGMNLMSLSDRLFVRSCWYLNVDGEWSTGNRKTRCINSSSALSGAERAREDVTNEWCYLLLSTSVDTMFFGGTFV